jgi:hypothetical protein
VTAVHKLAIRTTLLDWYAARAAARILGPARGHCPGPSEKRARDTGLKPAHRLLAAEPGRVDVLTFDAEKPAETTVTTSAPFATYSRTALRGASDCPDDVLLPGLAEPDRRARCQSQVSSFAGRTARRWTTVPPWMTVET